MPFTPKRGTFYRMPVFFGPTPGPRQSPGLESDTVTKHLVLSVDFRSDAEQLQALLPARFEVWGEPIVTIDVHYMKQIPWLAGRGYNMSDVKFPAVYHSRQGPVHGTFVLLRWENLADPILSGREELGHNKLWCNIPEPSVLNGTYRVKLDWLGHPFMDLKISDLAQDTAPAPIDPLHQANCRSNTCRAQGSGAKLTWPTARSHPARPAGPAWCSDG